MGSTEEAEHYIQSLNHLSLDVAVLVTKQNLMINSMISLWNLLGKSTQDLQIELLCDREIESLQQMIHESGSLNNRDLIPQTYFLPNSSTGDRQQSFDFGSIAF